MKAEDLLYKFVQQPNNNEISYVYDIDRRLIEYPLLVFYIRERSGQIHIHKDFLPSIDYVKVHTGQNYLIIDSSDVTSAEKRALVSAIFNIY